MTKQKRDALVRTGVNFVDMFVFLCSQGTSCLHTIVLVDPYSKIDTDKKEKLHEQWYKGCLRTNTGSLVTCD